MEQILIETVETDLPPRTEKERVSPRRREPREPDAGDKDENKGEERSHYLDPMTQNVKLSFRDADAVRDEQKEPRSGQTGGLKSDGSEPHIW